MNLDAKCNFKDFQAKVLSLSLHSLEIYKFNSVLLSLYLTST